MTESSHETVRDTTRTITTDRDGVIRQWGDAYGEALGYSAEEAVGRKIDLIIPPAMHAMHWRGFNMAMASGHLKKRSQSVRLVKVPAVHKDGRIIPLRANLEVPHADNGDAHGAVATFLGTGPAWRGAAWRVALAPMNFAQRMRQKPSSGG